MRNRLPKSETPDSVGLAYGAWAPVGQDGKVPDGDRAKWLGKLADLQVAPDYVHAFRRWTSSFTLPGDRTVEVALVSRLLVGHGNSSPTEVGLTTHHTWGVPLVPGTALKGLLAHYVDSVYGPEDPSLRPWEQPGDERERACYQGPTWDGSRILYGPGHIYRTIFGAPDADGDDRDREHDLVVGGSRGEVVFHDALYVPGSTPGDRPFAVDVLTPHQKPYQEAGGRSWPNDYSAPVPVGFLSVRPGARFLLALSGPAIWTERAERLLLAALADWGVGAKTSSGYGRLVAHGVPPAAGHVGRAPVSGSGLPGTPFRRGARITVSRVEDRAGRRRFQAPDGRPGHFAGEPPPTIEVGGTVEVWVANVSPHAYTLSLRRPGQKN